MPGGYTICDAIARRPPVNFFFISFSRFAVRGVPLLRTHSSLTINYTSISVFVVFPFVIFV